MFLPLHYQNRKVAQLVAHYVRDVGVGRSSRLFPTKEGVSKRRDLFFLQSLISEMPPLSDRKEGVSKRRTLFFCTTHKSLISEMPPLSDRNALTLLCKNVCRKCKYHRIYLYICECDKDFTCFYYCGTEISDLPN